ncbi:DUF4097 family beta strand repeat-containing protein [Vagococcus intermedius]|uniref:DUF4097 domain-containing protein n=1 Tax=Vagococcus intermedius TaxID=2991418 RepID=A0AAF0CUP5_9ENTE|nr:DUF4097 family beta strand repeat-containing protein [Vagococcus intermedius]WEG73253.1 DUF4097 domain-containing protein [Vagococcus intermedius]WEG75338.1 DUF4097 domain-containing protein [Vagococcus intermedius]
MKKRIIALASIGTVLLTVGAIGSITYFNKAEKQARTTIKETYKPHNHQELVLNLHGNTVYDIRTSDDNKFHLSGNLYTLDNNQSLTWQPNEKNNKTIVPVTFKESTKPSLDFGFNLWNDQRNSVKIDIPSTYKEITIKNTSYGHLNLDGIKTKKLHVENKKGAISLEDIKADQAEITSDSSSINAIRNHLDGELILKSTHGEINILDLTAKKLTAETINNNLFAENITADFEAKSEYGDINLTNIIGKVQTENTNGYTSWYQEKIIEDSDLNSINGGINLELERLPRNIELNATSKLGDISLLDSDKEALKIGRNQPKVSLETSSGDIYVTSDEDTDED